jgi:hypothetical protein
MAMGRPYIWREDIRELPWFGQAPGYPGTGYVAYSSPYGARATGPYTQYPATTYGGNIVQQQPGHSIVINPGRGGMPAVVSQVPSGV